VEVPNEGTELAGLMRTNYNRYTRPPSLKTNKYHINKLSVAHAGIGFHPLSQKHTEDRSGMWFKSRRDNRKGKQTSRLTTWTMIPLLLARTPGK
jgi:hypothetical protein